MRLNPIVKKDVKVQARSMKICWGIFAYEVILALVFFLAMAFIRQQGQYSTNNIYSYMVWLYPVLAVTQLVILGVVVPVRTASSISGERERQTFDIMMTTSMTPFSVIMGKVSTAIVQSMFFVVASMPVMALCFIIGGMSWAYLFWFLGIALLVSIFSASIGILCSSLCKKSIGAVIMSYGFYLIFFVGTVIPYLVYEIFEVNTTRTMNMTTTQVTSSGDGFILVLLLNPFVYVVEFFAQVMVGESLVGDMFDVRGTMNNHGVLHVVTTGHGWMIISTILFLAVSFLFLIIASRCINPIKKKGKKSGK